MCLGILSRRGEGVPQSYERAAELYRQAAAQGHAEAQYNLGYLYYNGLGVPEDVVRGVALWKQAAAGGRKEAADALRALGEAVPPGGPAAAGAPQPHGLTAPGIGAGAWAPCRTARVVHNLRTHRKNGGRCEEGG